MTGGEERFGQHLERSFKAINSQLTLFPVDVVPVPQTLPRCPLFTRMFAGLTPTVSVNESVLTIFSRSSVAERARVLLTSIGECDEPCDGDFCSLGAWFCHTIFCRRMLFY